MTRIDWLILRRISSRIGLAVLIVFGLIALVESLDTWRFTTLSESRGVAVAVLAIIVSAARWTIKTLSVTVLIGAVLGMLELQARRELTVIKSSGLSIWRIMRAPLIAVLLAGAAISLVAEGVTTQINRAINYASPNIAGPLTPAGEVWLEQQEANGPKYILMALKMQQDPVVLSDVTVFLPGSVNGERMTAPEARLGNGEWEFPTAMHYRIDKPIQAVFNATLPTTTTESELALKLRSTEDMTLIELGTALAKGISDRPLRVAAMTRLVKLATLPLLLVGSLFIAFAFTAGYRRSNKYGTSILYAIVLGFVVFVITEMADRAGSSGVIDPVFAAAGPAFVAIVIGATVLLFKEDGRA